MLRFVTCVKRAHRSRRVLRNGLSEVVLSSCQAGYSFSKGSKERNSFFLVMRRPLFIITTAIVLYLIATLFLVFVATREVTSKVLANGLGYMAALWGIRQIIVGSTQLFPTVIDLLTLGLYVVVAFIVTYRWLFPSGQERTP